MCFQHGSAVPYFDVVPREVTVSTNLMKMPEKQFELISSSVIAVANVSL